jgi:hypothetical protein
VTDAPVAKQKRPTWLQGLLIGGASVIVGLGGCATFFASLGPNSEVLAYIGAGAFLLGVLGVIVGGIWFIVGVLKAVLSK